MGGICQPGLRNAQNEALEASWEANASLGSEILRMSLWRHPAWETFVRFCWRAARKQISSQFLAVASLGSSLGIGEVG